MRVVRAVVTGGRGYLDKEYVYRVLGAVFGSVSEVVLAQGGCPTGVDALVREWVEERKRYPSAVLSPDDWRAGRNLVLECRTYAAAWTHFGRSAGPRRNRQMLEGFRPHFVLAFPGGRGTEDCVRQAKLLGIPVLMAHPPDRHV